MNKINSYNTKNNCIINDNIQSDNNHKKENAYNIYLQNKQNTFSYPIISSYCININKQSFNKDEKMNLNKKDFFQKGGGNYIGNNLDNNCSSTLEIIEYPLSEIQKNKNIIKNDKIGKNENYKYDKNVPVEIKGDSDDDIYLNEEDFEKINKKQSSKMTFQNSNFYNSSKTSSFAKSDLFVDNKNQKKIAFILNNTKKYHDELKTKINNFKKLIYPIKEKNNENSHTSNNKFKKEINSKFHSSLKDNKSKKYDHLLNSNKKNLYLKPAKKEYIPLNSNIAFNNMISRDISISNIKANNIGVFSNNFSNKINNKYSEIYHKKSFKSKNTKNNFELKDNDKKISIKKNNLDSSKIINNNNLKDNYKINNIINKNKETNCYQNNIFKDKNQNQNYLNKNEKILTEKIFMNSTIKSYNPFKEDLNKNENKKKRNII